jgi:hypothetical protein
VNQFAGLDRGRIFEPLAVADRVDAAGFLLHPARFGQLSQVGEAGFIAHEIFAALHRGDAQRGALVGDGSADDELQRFIIQNFVDAAWRAWGYLGANRAIRSGSRA